MLLIENYIKEFCIFKLPEIPTNSFLINFFNYLFIPECEVGVKSGSLKNLLKLTPVIMTCLIMMVVAMTWGFLDPTLEPHLRKVSQLSVRNSREIIFFHREDNVLSFPEEQAIGERQEPVHFVVYLKCLNFCPSFPNYI